MRAAGIVGVVLWWGLGCGGSGASSSTSLAELHDAGMHVEPLLILDPANAQPMGLVIEHEGCFALGSNLVAKVNGNPMTMIYAGGEAGEAADGGCTQTTFQTPDYLGEPAGPVTFNVTDGTTTWQMTVPGLFDPRSVTVQSPVRAEGMAGQLLVLQWSPATDVFDPALGDGYDVQFVAEGASAPTWDVSSPSAVMVNGARIQWTIPTPVANASRGVEGGSLEFRGNAHAAVTSCVGVARCAADVAIQSAQSLAFAVVVQ